MAHSLWSYSLVIWGLLAPACGLLWKVVLVRMARVLGPSSRLVTQLGSRRKMQMEVDRAAVSFLLICIILVYSRSCNETV
ncbi:hypothetical protein EDD85DRAFT_1026576, partial [Armillaria nabsnona]